MRSDGERSLRVLAADDSAVMREVLRTIFAMHEEGGDRSLPRMELCGVARDGVEALEQVETLRPDVLLLDLEMPRLNGLGVLERLKSAAPMLPVILCSTYTERGARATMDGLAHGAKDYVTKPEHQKNYAAALESLTKQLLPKIAALAISGQLTVTQRGRFGAKVEYARSGARVEVVVIGVSTGGPLALETLLPALPNDFPVAVLIVQHMPRVFTGALSERLNRLCAMPVREARDGVEIEAGAIWISPGDMHMEVGMGTSGHLGSKMKVIRLREAPPVRGSMPSVDLLFCSAAKAYRAGTLAVVMTGMGSDGTEGARAVRAAGGVVLAQDQASSAVWGMPARVVDEGLAAEILPLKLLAGALATRVQTIRMALPIRREVMYGVL